jgi:MFS family permease
MIYLKKTLEYLFVLERGKRFFILFFLSIPIGIIAAYLSPNWEYTTWAMNYTTGNANFWSIWNFGNNGIVFPIAGAIMVVFAVIFLSIQATVVSRSMRVGIFKVNRLIGEFNESFFPSLYAVLSYLLMYLAYKCITTLFLILFQAINVVILSFVLSVIALFAVFVFSIIGISLTTLYFPIMTITGIKPQPAIIASLHKCSKNTSAFVLAMGLPILTINIIGALIGILQIPLLSEMVDAVLYSFLFCYINALAMVSYYELEQIKREDYPREYYYKR